jgi:hypothetical protein
MLFLDTATSTRDLPCLQASFVEVFVSESVDCCLVSSLDCASTRQISQKTVHTPYSTENFAESDSKVVDKYMHYA